jgi:hypothetical protein
LQDGKVYAAKIMPKAEKKRKASQQLQSERRSSQIQQWSISTHMRTAHSGV